MAEYEILLNADARRSIAYLLRQGLMSKGEHQRLVNAIATRLRYQPGQAQGSVKRLRQPNRLNAAYELRVQPWRVLYNVNTESGIVQIQAVGFKPRERLLIEGVEVDL